MGAPPIHHIPIRVNDSLSQEIARVEKGVMSNIPNENPLKVRNNKSITKVSRIFPWMMI